MILFLLAFVAFLIIGVPISVSIGFSAVLGCLSLGYPLVVIGQKMVSGIDSWLLIAIPLFILAGNLMNAGKITDELFGTARELVGWIPGGLGHANVLASVIFAGMSGSASADAGGLGAIEIKAMRESPEVRCICSGAGRFSDGSAPFLTKEWQHESFDKDHRHHFQGG